MWWKLALAVLIGIAIGVAGTVIHINLFNSAIQDVRAGYIPQRWSSADKQWPVFAEWLRHGGRKLVMDAAFSAARQGMTEDEVRAAFGPPDFVVVGAEELNSNQVAHVARAGGAYLYKIGRFATIPNKLTSEVFEIVFDASGKIIYRLGIGVNDGDKLADIDSDTRSERRIVH